MSTAVSSVKDGAMRYSPVKILIFLSHKIKKVATSHNIEDGIRECLFGIFARKLIYNPVSKYFIYSKDFSVDQLVD